MSVTSYSIAKCLNFALKKQETERFIGIFGEGVIGKARHNSRFESSLGVRKAQNA